MHEILLFLSSFSLQVFTCSMMTNYRSSASFWKLAVSVGLALAGWNVGFFYWDQFADEVSGSGKLSKHPGCLVQFNNIGLELNV